MIRANLPVTERVRVVDAQTLLIELSQLRKRLSPDLAVLADALSYCIVGIDHLLMHAHDDEPTEH
jgi:hypothetical protein